MIDVSVFSLVSLFISSLGVVFAYLAFKRSKENDNKENGKTEGIMFSELGYIKACVDRVEKNLNKVDERYGNIAERLAKVEESVSNVVKRVDEIYNTDEK